MAKQGSSRQVVRLELFRRAVEIAKRRRIRDLQEQHLLPRSLSQQLSNFKRGFAKKKASPRDIQDRVTIVDFELTGTIGQGNFGVVRLCRKRDTGDVFALKQVIKDEMIQQHQVEQIKAERLALAMAQRDASNSWVVCLHYTFQDDRYLFLAMEYLPGGDLMTHLMRKHVFSEAEMRFYTAELVEAVDYIHRRLYCVHRDLKPDNIVLDAAGHLRIIDFGLCRRLSQFSTHSVVGTADYMAPEVYRGVARGNSLDWWAVGIIAFEMLFGGPPFSDEQRDPADVCARVLKWQEYFYMPEDPRVSSTARELLQNLICEPNDRLDAQGLRTHPFFDGVDFAALRTVTPPIRPEVHGPLDTSNFDDFSDVGEKYAISVDGSSQLKARMGMLSPQSSSGEDSLCEAIDAFGGFHERNKDVFPWTDDRLMLVARKSFARVGGQIVSSIVTRMCS